MRLQKLSVTSAHKRQTGLSERKFHVFEELGVYDSFAGSKFHLGCVRMMTQPVSPLSTETTTKQSSQRVAVLVALAVTHARRRHCRRCAASDE